MVAATWKVGICELHLGSRRDTHRAMTDCQRHFAADTSRSPGLNQVEAVALQRGPLHRVTGKRPRVRNHIPFK